MDDNGVLFYRLVLLPIVARGWSAHLPVNLFVYISMCAPRGGSKLTPKGLPRAHLDGRNNIILLIATLILVIRSTALIQYRRTGLRR